MIIRIGCLWALIVVVGCGGTPGPQDSRGAASAGSPENAASAGRQPAVTQAVGSTTRLGEFEPLTKADADLYMKVMRAAADRVKNMSSADRQALKTFKTFGSRANPNQMPTAEEMAAVQRASELMSPDLAVARQLGVSSRYESIRGRIPEYGMPPMTGEGDEPLSAEERARVRERVAKFKERQRLDEATLAPYKDEIQALQKQVYYVGREEMVPQ